MTRWITGVALGALLAGCSGMPEARDGALGFGTSWMHGGEHVAETTLTDTWWTVLGDPVLDNLVQRALTSGNNLKIAAARVEQARAVRSAAQANFWPTLNAGGSATYAERSQNIAAASGARQGHTFSSGFDAAWELDLFGANRKAAEAARASLKAAHFDYADARLSLLAEVVTAYADYRMMERRLALAEQNVKAQERTAQLTEARFRAGDVSGLDQAQAKAQLAATRSLVPTLRMQLEGLRGTLAVLAGEPATTFYIEPATAELKLDVPDVRAGVPSDVLMRRPDVAAAEKRLESAVASVAEAQALRLPRISLTGSIGNQSSQLSNLLANGSGFWSLIPQATLPLIDGGARRAAVKLRSAQQEEALGLYRQTVLVALKDVEGALVNLDQSRTRFNELTLAARSSERAYALSSRLYGAGEIGLTPLLQSQQAMLQAQDGEAQAVAQGIQAWVSLIKALGGGTAKLDGEAEVSATSVVNP